MTTFKIPVARLQRDLGLVVWKPEDNDASPASAVFGPEDVAFKVEGALARKVPYDEVLEMLLSGKPTQADANKAISPSDEQKIQSMLHYFIATVRTAVKEARFGDTAVWSAIHLFGQDLKSIDPLLSEQVHTLARRLANHRNEPMLICAQAFVEILGAHCADPLRHQPEQTLKLAAAVYDVQYRACTKYMLPGRKKDHLAAAMRQVENDLKPVNVELAGKVAQALARPGVGKKTQETGDAAKYVGFLLKHPNAEAEQEAKVD